MVTHFQDTTRQLRERTTGWDGVTDTELGLSEILEIAREIENRRLHLYLGMVEQSEDAELHNLCHWFAIRSERRANMLACRYRDVRGIGTASPHSLAALAFFAAEEGGVCRVRAAITKTWLLQSEIDRSRRALVFHRGLKGFTRDEIAKEMIDEIMREESKHLGEMMTIQAGAARESITARMR